MPIAIEEVTDTAGREAFLDFPKRIYAGDPAWVPPLREWVRKRISPSNPFFQEATLRLFAAKRDGEIVGTISALRDTRWEKHKNEKTAFFGFFETLDDIEVVRALLAAASDAARAWGAETLRGPRNVTRVEEVGITVEGHDLPPPMLANHQPPYYQRLLEAEGFEKHHDVLAYHIRLFEPDGSPLQLPEKLREKSDAVDLPGLEIRQVRWRTMSADLTAAHHVFTEAFKTVPDTTPMPKAQFMNLGRAVMALTNPRMMQLAFVNGAPIAFAVCLPELNEAVIRAEGHLMPLGWASFVRGLGQIHTASFKLIGVLPEYRQSGIHARLISHVVDGLRAGGYQRLEASLVDERNGPMRAVVEGAGMTVYRRYRIYDRKL